jgi:fructose-1,6-bisphosphatase/inositol monophosphatase family enzyme
LPLNPHVPVLKDALAGVDFKRLPSGFGEVLVREHPFYSQRNLGSAALEICYVASGCLDIYLHGGLMLWDFAGASLILSEAGGHAGRLEMPADADFWSVDVFRKSVVAGKTPKLYQTWHAWLAANR